MNRQDQIERIHAFVAEYQARQTDAGPFLDLHTDDTAIVNMVGRRVLGKTAFGAASRAALAGPMAKVITNLDIEDIRFATPDVAIVSLTKRVDDQRDTAERSESDGNFPSTGSLSLVLVDGSDGWRVALAQSTPRFV